MLDGLKHAMVRRAVADLRGQWQEAVRSWVELLESGQSLDGSQRAAVWSVLIGMQAALRGLEAAAREARKDVQGRASRAIANTVYAIGTTRQLLEEHVIPYAEVRLGNPPAQGRWKFEKET